MSTPGSNTDNSAPIAATGEWVSGSRSNRASTLKVLAPEDERVPSMAEGCDQDLPKDAGEPTGGQMSYWGAWIYESIKVLVQVLPQMISPETIKRSKYIKIRSAVF